MSFSGFDLFSDVARNYINPEIVNDISGIRDLNSAFSVAADNIFGLIPGGSLANLRKFGLANYGFIVDTVTGERLAFQYNVVPRESGGMEVAEQKCLARSVPRFHYTGGRFRELTLPITFTMKESSREDVRRSVRWLQSLAYPDYNSEDEASMSPHPVVVVQGKLYQSETWVVRDFSIEWGDALDPVTQLPSEATVSLTLIELVTRGKSQSEVIRL